jgi:nitroreductase
MQTQTAPFDLDEVDRLLTTTRAVRRRLDLDRPVEVEVIFQCLRLATFAPSASNTQLWRWIVVTDEDLRARIAAWYREAFHTYARGGAAGPEDEGAAAYDGDAGMARIYDASMYLADNLHRVPAFVIPCYLGTPDPGGGNIALTTMYGSILQAAWSFQLALRSRGLGSAWTTLHLWHERDTANLLGIPDGVTQVALLPVAYTKGTDFKPPPRLPAEQVTGWNGWETTEEEACRTI